MAVDHKIEALQQVDLFSGCSKKELQAIARLCTTVDVDEGSVLTTQGDLGRECFVIADGKATVTIDGYPIRDVKSSDLIGEMALLDGGRRSATVIATSPLTLYVMTPSEFRHILRDNPDFAAKIMTKLARRLREAEANRPH